MVRSDVQLVLVLAAIALIIVNQRTAARVAALLFWLHLTVPFIN